MPNRSRSVSQILYLLRLISSGLTLYVELVNGFQLTKGKKILTAFCNSQLNSNLFIREIFAVTIGSKLSFEEYITI